MIDETTLNDSRKDTHENCAVNMNDKDEGVGKSYSKLAPSLSSNFSHTTRNCSGLLDPSVVFGRLGQVEPVFVWIEHTCIAGPHDFCRGPLARTLPSTWQVHKDASLLRPGGLH